MDMNYLIQFLWLTIFLEHSCHDKCTTWWKYITQQRWQAFWKDLLLLTKYCRSFVRNIWSKSFVTLYWTRLYGRFSLTSIFMPLTFSFVSIEFAFLCVTQGTFGNFRSERHLEGTHLSFHSSNIKRWFFFFAKYTSAESFNISPISHVHRDLLLTLISPWHDSLTCLQSNI